MTRLLTKTDIIELQRNCYGQIEEIKVKQFDVEVTLKVGSMISEGSYFDIHKFAEAVEDAVIKKLEQIGSKKSNTVHGRGRGGHEQVQGPIDEGGSGSSG